MGRVSDSEIVAAARAEGVPVGVFRALVQQESGNQTGRTSPKGAFGPTQLMPGTAASLGVSRNSSTKALLRAGARYFKQQLDGQGGNVENALRAYNAGPGAVKASHGYAETNHYVQTILANARRLGDKAPSGASVASDRVDSDRVNGRNSANARIAKAMGLLDAGASSLLSSPATAGVSADTPGNRLNALRTFQRTGDTLGFAQKISSLRAQEVAAVPADTTTTSLLSDALGASGTPTGATGDHSAAAAGGTKGGHDAKGVVDFEGKKVAAWIAPALQYARQRGWKGSVNSGYRSFADQTRIYNSGVRPAARPGTSNHEGTDFPRGAIDVSDAQTLSRILQRSPYAKKLIYAGAKDPVHFSHPHGGSY